MFRSMKSFILPPLPLRVIEKLYNEVRMGDLDYFFENILPPTPSKLDISRVFERCVKNEILTKGPHSENYIWGVVPKGLDDPSDRAYVKPFMRIFHAVIKAAQETSTSNIGTIPFKPIDGGKARLSDYDDYRNEESLSPYVYIENPKVSFKGSIRNRHWYTSGFGFHFKRSDEDDIDVSALDFFSCYLY